ncbi:MAG: PAS domain-containing protein [Pontibacterium sp.]
MSLSSLFSFQTLKLRTRMVIILGMMALAQTGVIGAFAIQYLTYALEEQVASQSLNLAHTLANTPHVIKAVRNKDSDFLQPYSLRIADAAGARFIVFGDNQAQRLSHPNVDRLGKSMGDDDGDNNHRTLILRESYTQKATGSLGASLRGKAPIIDEHNQVVGLVSVGYMLTSVDMLINSYTHTLVSVILVAFMVSVIVAIWVANHFKRAIFGLEPEEIGRLFQERNATLQSVREGIIAINANEEITTINKAAVRILDLPAPSELVGKHIKDVLPRSQMLQVLASGEPQFDHERMLTNRSLIVNRVPLKTGNQVTGVVSSFRLKDELDMVSAKLTHIQEYANSLRSQAHEYSNKLHTIAGLIEIGANDKALEVIGHETQDQQDLIQLLMNSVPDPILAGVFLGKYSRAKEMGLTLHIDPDSHMAHIPDHIPREHLVTQVSGFKNSRNYSLSY